MPVKKFMPPSVPLYTRRRLTSNTGKEYWGFEKVNLGAGRKPAGPFWLRHTDEYGKQKWVTAGDDYTAAIELRDRMMRVKLADRQGLPVDEADRKEAADIGTQTLADAVAAFLKDKEQKRKCRPRTLQAYGRTLENFKECVGSRVRFVNELKKDHVWQFVQCMEKAGLAQKTINVRVMYLRIFLKHVDSSVKLQDKELPKLATKTVKAYDAETVAKLRKAAKGKERMVIDFFLGTGCREQEGMHAEWSDIDFAHRQFHVQEKPAWGFIPKDYEDRPITISAELVTALKEYKKNSTSSLLFPNSEGKPDGHLLRIVKRVALRANLNCGECEQKQDGESKRSCLYHATCKEFNQHRFRKTWATGMHHAGVPLRDLQKMLGHESLETTENYLADSAPEHIRAAADKAFSFSLVG